MLFDDPSFGFQFAVQRNGRTFKGGRQVFLVVGRAGYILLAVSLVLQPPSQHERQTLASAFQSSFTGAVGILQTRRCAEMYLSTFKSFGWNPWFPSEWHCFSARRVIQAQVPPKSYATSTGMDPSMVCVWTFQSVIPTCSNGTNALVSRVNRVQPSRTVRNKFRLLRLRESQLSLVSLRPVGYAVLDTGFCVRMGTTMSFRLLVYPPRGRASPTWTKLKSSFWTNHASNLGRIF